MKQYNTYKYSGVEWLGEIPTHWDVKRLKSVIKEHFSGLWGEDAKQNDYDRLCIRIADFDFERQSVSPSASTMRNYTEKQIRSTVLHDNDLLLEKSGGGDKTPVGRVVIYKKHSDKEDLFANFCECLRVRENQSPSYIAYLLKVIYAKTMMRQFYKQTTGLQNIDIPDYLGMKIILPPIIEQEAIVTYLDEKTAEIDVLVGQVEREIELLKEYKQAEIARVVTHGLNPTVPMKPSGISWIGDIPAHWEVQKINQNFTERREKVSDKDYEPLSVTKEGVLPQLDTAAKTNNGDNRKKVCKGDFVVNSRSDRKGSCGFSYYDGSVSLINTVLIPRNNIFGRYYHYVFRSNNFIEEFYRLGRGIVADLWTTRYAEQRNIMIPVPPIEEQQMMVDFIDHRTADIDRLVVELTYQVEYLKEYKQRLIADVVTGKINVQPN